MGDRGDFRTVNDFARHTSWLHGFFQFWAVYGIVVFAVLVILAWWFGRQADSATTVTRAIWAPIAGAIALVINQPIVHAVDETRPFVAMPHVLTLVSHARDAGFPSDHSVFSGALAAGLLLTGHRVLGGLAVLAAALVAFGRVYVGVHYPIDVLVGLALGVVVCLLGAPLAARVIRPIVVGIGHRPGAFLVRAAPGRHQAKE